MKSRRSTSLAALASERASKSCQAINPSLLTKSCANLTAVCKSGGHAVRWRAGRARYHGPRRPGFTSRLRELGLLYVAIPRGRASLTDLRPAGTCATFLKRILKMRHGFVSRPGLAAFSGSRAFVSRRARFLGRRRICIPPWAGGIPPQPLARLQNCGSGKRDETRIQKLKRATFLQTLHTMLTRVSSCERQVSFSSEWAAPRPVCTILCGHSKSNCAQDLYRFRAGGVQS